MKRTLLIIGAGASKAVYRYFPTGFELLEKINAHLFNDQNDVQPEAHEGSYVSDLTNKLQQMLANSGEDADVATTLKIYKKKLYQYWAAHESDAMRQDLSENISIDAFTDDHKEIRAFVPISQYATAHILRGTENAYFQAVSKSSNHWIQTLCKEIDQQRCGEVNLENSLYIVSFNYDRLFPYLLREYAFQQAGIFGTSCKAFLESNMHYMYGSLGSLEEIPFESPNNDMEKMITAYRKFELLTPTRPKKQWTDKDAFDGIAFIGFGFDKENFANLNLARFAGCTVWSTFYGETKPQHHQVSLLEGLFDKGRLNYHDDANKLVSDLCKSVCQ